MNVYTMKQLAEKLERSPQSIHGVMRDDETIRALVPTHKIQRGKRNFVYDEVMLEALLVYYGYKAAEPEKKDTVDSVVGGGVEDTENPENPQTNPPPPVEADINPSAAVEEQIEGLQAKIEALEKQLQEQAEAHQRATADLEKQLQDKEAERLHFIGENAKLISLLTAEKQEKDKLLLLMPPQEHRTVWQKVKGLFTRKEGGKNE